MHTEEGYTFTSVLERSGNKLWSAHFVVPNIAAHALSEGSDRRVVCTLNQKITYQCALVPFGDNTLVITVNKKNCDLLRLKPGSPIEVVLRKDDSTYGLPMPEELAAVLEQDTEGNELFHALTPGKIRTLLYLAGFVKNSDKRLLRALAIVEHLKNNKGKVDYKQLNAAMRDKL
jgi:Domain of unknown function (DUF1905)